MCLRIVLYVEPVLAADPIVRSTEETILQHIPKCQLGQGVAIQSVQPIVPGSWCMSCQSLMKSSVRTRKL